MLLLCILKFTLDRDVLCRSKQKKVLNLRGKHKMRKKIRSPNAPIFILQLINTYHYILLNNIRENTQNIALFEMLAWSTSASIRAPIIEIMLFINALSISVLFSFMRKVHQMYFYFQGRNMLPALNIFVSEIRLIMNDGVNYSETVLVVECHSKTSINDKIMTINYPSFTTR